MSLHVLVIGGGGREHALAEALARSPQEPRVTVAPGNGGVARRFDVASEARDAAGWRALAHDCSLVVVGPEAPLTEGLADALRADGIPVLGPSAEAARLEGSKAFAKQIMAEADVPTARAAAFTEAGPAIAYARELGRAVVKADGLAAGKGVRIPETDAETDAAIHDLLGGALGAAGSTVVIEERLEGEEVSVIAVCDGTEAALLAPAQDHKRVGEGDTGPNTGGMGAYSPAPVAPPELEDEVRDRCILPVLRRMAERGTPFRGVLYAGIMVTADGPKVLEYNVRFGDPEAQVILPRMADDPLELFRAAATGTLQTPRAACTPDVAATVVMAASGYPGPPRSGDVIEGLAAAEATGARVYFAGVRARDDGALETSGGRVLAVTGLGPSLRDALGQAYQGVDAIGFDGAHFRRDIGYRALERERRP
jgi:phosphoribosylamine--glycine ligase